MSGLISEQLTLQHQCHNSQQITVKNTHKISKSTHCQQIEPQTSKFNYQNNLNNIHNHYSDQSSNIIHNNIKSGSAPGQKLVRSLNDKSAFSLTKKQLKGYMHIPEKYLCKNKKYYRKDAKENQKQNLIRNDIENIMQSIAHQKLENDYILINLQKNYDNFLNNSRNRNKKQFSNHSNANFNKCPLSIAKKYNYCEKDKKISLQNQKNFFTKNESSLFQSNQILKELKSYIKKLKTSQSANNQGKSNSYKDYLKLTQDSYDYLEYYLKATSYITENFNSSLQEIQQLQQILKTSGTFVLTLDKKMLLSSLRSNYKCFQPQYNPPQLINRILLSFDINPLNQFQFISKQTFYKIRKLILGEFNKRQAKQFMINYVFLKRAEVNSTEVQNIFKGIYKKLNKVTSQKAIQLLLQKIGVFARGVVAKIMGGYRQQRVIQFGKNLENGIFTRENYKDMLDNDPFFLFQDVIQLLFIV